MVPNFKLKNESIDMNLANQKIKLIYAGSPAKKDYLKEIIEAVMILTKEEREKIELHVVGVDIVKLKELCGILNLPDCIKAYGRVTRERVLEILGSMDFSVLLRPERERYAMAGFPTKSVEAMTQGVAMMCNLTSDLGMYLKDKENSIILTECSSDAVVTGIRRIFSLSSNEISIIKKNARNTAVLNFDWSIYQKDIKVLIS